MIPSDERTADIEFQILRTHRSSVAQRLRIPLPAELKSIPCFVELIRRTD